MKLRKALDKAKEERGEYKEVIGALAPRPQDGDWSAPDYSRSTEVRVSPEQLVRNRCVCINPEAPELDAYKVLRTQIQQRAKENGWKTMMITSAVQGEGKTLTAVNLALTFAKEFNQTVLLVDGDLKQQMIHTMLGFASKRGLVDYLVDNQPLEDLIIWPGIDKLTFISGGKKIPESTELLASPKMRSLVEEMKSRYADRFIIFDVPPLLDRADALAFAPLVDCILMVVQSGKTSIHDVQKAVELIPKEKFLGFVLNRQGTAHEEEQA